MNIKLLFATTIALLLPITVFPKGAIAGQTPPTQVHCYFLQNENLTLKNMCTYQGSSWAGGGQHTLTWEDGIQTILSYGSGSRGGLVCPENQVRVDGDVCGIRYVRSAKNLNRMSDSYAGSNLTCVQLNKKSICWKLN